MRIEQLKKNFDVIIQWTAFPLHPETPEDGLSLEELFAGRPINIEHMLQRLKQAADEVGLPLGERKKTYNSRLAQELAKWAESLGKGDLFHEAVFRAYFVEGSNIGRVETLIKLAGSIGLPENQASAVLTARSFKEAVDTDWLRSRTLGITAVPSFVVDRRKLVGAQPYHVLEQFMVTAGAKRVKNQET